MINVKKQMTIIGLFVISAAAFFESQIVLQSQMLLALIQFMGLGLIVLGDTSKRRKRSVKGCPTFIAFWLMLIPFFSYGLIHNERLVTLRLIVCYSLVLFLSVNYVDWTPLLVKIIRNLAFVSVAATLFFYAVPQAYAAVVHYYGYYPPGTGRLQYGYRAGVSAHYSQNGIFIALFLMTMAADFLLSREKKRKFRKKYPQILFILLGFTAFFLNGKRGPLIWMLISIGITASIISKNKGATIWKALFAAILALGVLQLMSESVPQIQLVLNRLSTIGSDDSSYERMEMWKMAFEYFKKSPIFGIGFMNFRGLYASNLSRLFSSGHVDASYKRLDAHNVYIQMLCETGLVGVSIYLNALRSTLQITIKLMGEARFDSEQRKALLFSVIVQLFFIFYSLSGNCLYDFTIIFYTFALAITYNMYRTRSIWRSQK